MVLVQVKRNLENALRKHVSQNGIPKHLSSLKDEAFKWYGDQGKFCPQALSRYFLKGHGVNAVLGLKYRLSFQNIVQPNSTYSIRKKIN